MGMLDRYKKKGGFTQLLMLIESSGRQKQDQFLTLIAQESPVWERAIRQKCLSLEKILSWEPGHLREILSRVQPLTLATALSGMPKENVEKILSCLSQAEQRRIQQVIDESRATPAEVSTCILKIVAETRGFLTSGIVKIDKIDVSMVIPENFEEQLANAEATAPFDLDRKSGGSETDAAQSPGATADDSKAVSKGDRDENEFLRKKLNHVVAENASLKQEIAVLRGKLDQIRKIA